MTNAIVAGHIPIAGGVALRKHRDTGQVVACFFGDGASCEGEFFETLNMAQLWQVPLVLVCENNGWAISVPTALSQATPDVADRARGFGMPASVVDGNDVIAVRDAVAAGVDRARAGGGPTFVECKTVRWERHSALSAGADPVEGRRAWQSRSDSTVSERSSPGTSRKATRSTESTSRLSRKLPRFVAAPSKHRSRRPSRSTRTSLPVAKARPAQTVERLTIRDVELIPILAPLAQEYRGSYYRMANRATVVIRIRTG